MTLNRTITIVTANLGRGVLAAEFKENLHRVVNQTPGSHKFFGFQEIDEADTPEEAELVRSALTKTHRFVGLKTHVPIAVPRTFEVIGRSVRVASEGVDRLSPRRHVVSALVHPVDHPNCKILPTNTHFAREAPALRKVRAEAEVVLKQRLTTKHPAWLTADLNSQRYEKLGENELRIVTARLDYIRGYERAGVKFNVLKTGSINLTIDGHNAHWAKVLVTWP